MSGIQSGISAAETQPHSALLATLALWNVDKQDQPIKEQDTTLYPY